MDVSVEVECNWTVCKSATTGKCVAWCKCRCHEARAKARRAARETLDYGHGFKPIMKTQYGVAIVWADPVEEGVCKAGESYVPRWYDFDDPEAAERHARAYKSRLGDKLPKFMEERFTEDIDLDEIWLAHGVKDVLRATRTAIESYGEWEIADG